jgi:hypothetical protein
VAAEIAGVVVLENAVAFAATCAVAAVAGGKAVALDVIVVAAGASVIGVAALVSGAADGAGVMGAVQGEDVVAGTGVAGVCVVAAVEGAFNAVPTVAAAVAGRAGLDVLARMAGAKVVGAELVAVGAGAGAAAVIGEASVAAVAVVETGVPLAAARRAVKKLEMACAIPDEDAMPPAVGWPALVAGVEGAGVAVAAGVVIAVGVAVCVACSCEACTMAWTIIVARSVPAVIGVVVAPWLVAAVGEGVEAEVVPVLLGELELLGDVVVTIGLPRLVCTGVAGVEVAVVVAVPAANEITPAKIAPMVAGVAEVEAGVFADAAAPCCMVGAAFGVGLAGVCALGADDEALRTAASSIATLAGATVVIVGVAGACVVVAAVGAGVVVAGCEGRGFAVLSLESPPCCCRTSEKLCCWSSSGAGAIGVFDGADAAVVKGRTDGAEVRMLVGSGGGGFDRERPGRTRRGVIAEVSRRRRLRDGNVGGILVLQRLGRGAGRRRVGFDHRRGYEGKHGRRDGARRGGIAVLHGGLVCIRVRWRGQRRRRGWRGGIRSRRGRG